VRNVRHEETPAAPLVRGYVELGLRLGKLVDGFVDCWFGDPATADRVRAEPPPDPRVLAGTAARLSADLAGTDLKPGRRRFLAAQLAALECTAHRLAGARISFGAEVRAYFGTEVTTGDPDRYAEAHDAIGGLLPGPGPLEDRLRDFYARNEIPPARLQQAVQAVSDRLRERTRELFALPDGERVDYEVVEDKPWNAFNRYHGGFRSSVALNAEAGRAVAALPIVVTHEAYPGHHTDHCVKEARLGGHDEQVISLVNTPQCLVAEGTAEVAVDALLGPGWGPWTAEILAGEGLFVEGELVEAVLTQLRRLFPARQDAAILLHDRGADPDDVVEYLRRWLLLPPDRARHMLDFLTDPLWRAYTVTYVEGARLAGEWLAARPAGQSTAERYAHLLDDQLLPADLREPAPVR
jgi:hypothetical protein